MDDVVVKTQAVVAEIRAALPQIHWELRFQAGKKHYVGEHPKWTVFIWLPETTGGGAMAAANAKGPNPTFNTVLFPKDLTDEALRLARTTAP